MAATFHECPADSVHPIHDSASVVKNDRVRQVRSQYQGAVFDDAAAGRLNRVMAVPMILVDLGERRHGDLLDRQIRAQLDQATYVPSQQAAR